MPPSDQATLFIQMFSHLDAAPWVPHDNATSLIEYIASNYVHPFVVCGNSTWVSSDYFDAVLDEISSSRKLVK